MPETEIEGEAACRFQRCRDRFNFTKHQTHSHKQRTFNQLDYTLKCADNWF